MDFSVEPGHLDSFSELIGRAADDMQAAMSYIESNTTVGGSVSSIVWDIISANHEEVVTEIKGGFKGFNEVLEASRAELARSAKYYRATDRATAAKLDRTYPRPGGVREEDPSDDPLMEIDPADFRDVKSPTDRLKSTDVDENYFQEWGGEFALNPPAKIFGTMLDFGSPVGLVAEGLKFCGIVDVFDKPVQWIGGDWEGYLKAATAWGCLAQLCTDVAENIEAGNRSIDMSWHGNSADVAWDYFHELAQKLRKATESLNSLRTEYELLARTVYNAAELAKGILVAICDLVVQVILFNIAAMAALASIAGAPEAAVLEALAAVRFLAALKRYREFLVVFESLASGGQMAALGLFTVATAFGNEIKSFPKPGASYDNRAV